MKKLFALIIAAGFSAAAYAGPATDNLSNCLADSTTGRDRVNLARWIIVAMSQHPAMSDISSAISAQKMDETNRAIGELYNRLMVQDCSTQLKTAVQTDGPAAVGKGFEVLGRLAMQELMANPQVAAGMAAPLKYIDSQKISKLTHP